MDGSIADAEALVRKAAAEEETARARERGGDDAEAADAMETDDGEIRGEIRDKREGDDDDGGDADADEDADAGGGRAKKRAKRGASDGGGGGKGAFYLTLVPIRPRRRGERRSLRTFPGASLRPGSLAFNPDTHRCRSTPTDAIQLHPGRTSGTGGGDDANETYAQHPLVVVLDVDGVSFVFRYLMNLHVVTVEAMKTDEKKKRAGRATKEKEEKGRARGGGDANAADAPPPGGPHQGRPARQPVPGRRRPGHAERGEQASVPRGVRVSRRLDAARSAVQVGAGAFSSRRFPYDRVGAVNADT